MTNAMPVPRVVVSRCLEFDACRYNGAMIPCRVVRLLTPFVEFVPVCPECEIGLGVPRKPIRVVRREGRLFLLQSETERDLSSAMRDFTGSFLDSLTDVDGFILKSRSPSCGPSEVRIYPGLGKVGAIDMGSGFFAGAVLERFGHLPVETDGRLRNYRIREHFLTRLFTLARFRAVRQAGTMAALVQFHGENKFLLQACNEAAMRTLGRLTANHERRPVQEVLADYATHLGRVFAEPPAHTPFINVLEHCLGFFSKDLSGREKQFFLGLVKRLREGRIPLSVPLNVLRAWAIRFEQDYLLQQTVFQPYPEALMDVSDSGKGRDL